MTPFVTSWTQKWPKMNQKSPKTPEILIKWLCWSQNAYRWVFLGWKTDCGVKIMTFWLFEGGKTILWRQIWRQISWNSQNVIQMMLECQQMIELSWWTRSLGEIMGHFHYIWCHIWRNNDVLAIQKSKYHKSDTTTVILAWKYVKI